MFKFQQYRVKAAEYGELVKSSADADESRKYQDLEDRFDALANNERGLADAYHDAVHVDESDALSRGGDHHAMEHPADVAAKGDLRYRRIRRKVVGDSGAPRADRPISAQAQG